MGRTAKLTVQTNKIYSKYAKGYNGRYLFYFGGGGSGKSIDAIQRRVSQIISQGDGGHKFLFIRKVATTIEDSIWSATKAAFAKWGLLSKCKINQQKKSIVYMPNGNTIIMKGLDDAEKIKSIDGITGILIEEITELEEADFIQLNLRLRGITKYPKQIYGMFNPVDKDHWLWSYVEPQLKGVSKQPKGIENIKVLCKEVWEFDQVTIDEDTGEQRKITTRTINTNYKHNRFLDKDYISTLKLLSSISDNHSQVYEHGRWGKTEKGNAFVHQFRETKHVADLKLNPSLPIHYTQDFNVVPYMSGLVIQMEYIQGGFWNGHTEYWDVRMLDELALEHPLNSAQDCGLELEMRYDLSLGFFLYGDASGNNRTGLKDVKTLFQDLEKGLTTEATKRIPRANPRYKNIMPKSLGRVAFINLLFAGKFPVRLRIDPKCENFIKDCKFTVQDKNGHMDKKIRDGHHLDAWTYFACYPDALGYLAEMS